MLKLSLIGNLVRDPETKTVNTQKGATTVTTFTLAVNGKTKEDVTYVRCSAWGARGENISKYMTKGGKLFVSGMPKVGTYVGNDGKPVATVEIPAVEDFEFCASGAAKAQARPAAAPNYDAKVEDLTPVDEDIPF